MNLNGCNGVLFISPSHVKGNCFASVLSSLLLLNSKLSVAHIFMA